MSWGIKAIDASNVNEALHKGLMEILDWGKEEDSRNGPVLVMTEPVFTTYFNPTQRVLFNPVRDANPFFHIMEALWMLAGRNDVAWPSFFAANMKNYTDDGKTYHGAYGYRWRNWFGYDQLVSIARELNSNPDSRRCVLTMWDGGKDPQMAAQGGKDVPCNTQAYFDVRGGRLNMTVCNRSNDVIWGAYGANSVHFSFLMEYLAHFIGVPVGIYRHLSNNFHVYLEKYPRGKLRDMMDATSDLYNEQMQLVPLVPDHTSMCVFDEAVKQFLDNPMERREYDIPFLDDVAQPAYNAFVARKADPDRAFSCANQIAADDWRIACIEWLQRRFKNAK